MPSSMKFDDPNANQTKMAGSGYPDTNHEMGSERVPLFADQASTVVVIWPFL